MPAKSKAQQRLFGMALAVRRGELKRNEVNKEVLDIVDGKMTDKEIEDFAATKHDGLKKYVKENNMKDLKEFLNESLNEDMDEKVKKRMRIDIKKFIRENYFYKTLNIALEPSEDGKFEVWCDKGNIVFNGNGGARNLTDGHFYWSDAPHDFEIEANVDSFEGMPKNIGASLIISCEESPLLNTLENYVDHIESSLIIRGVKNIRDLTGLVDISCRHFSVCNCDNLTSIAGMPEDIDQDITIEYCPKLKNLQGMPKRARKGLYIRYNDGLINLEGCPKTVSHRFVVRGCKSLETIEVCPEKVGESTIIRDCVKLTTIKKLPTSKEVQLIDCPELSGDENIIKNNRMWIYIYDCPKTEN